MADLYHLRNTSEAEQELLSGASGASFLKRMLDAERETIDQNHWRVAQSGAVPDLLRVCARMLISVDCATLRHFLPI